MSDATRHSIRNIAAATACVTGLIFCPPGTEAIASTTQVNFTGQVDFIQEDEYGTASPIPSGATPLLPYFVGATRVHGSYSYDPAAATDLNPLDATAGQYFLPGQLVIELPDIGMSITTGDNLSFSVYTGGSGEFHVNGNAAKFVGDAGGATPFSVSVVFYGPRAKDSLPTGPVNWTYGNLHIDFAEVTPYRDIFIGMAPVPEPAMWATMLLGLGLLAGASRRTMARNGNQGVASTH